VLPNPVFESPANFGGELMLYLSNTDVEAVLDMPACLEALRAGYADLGRGDAAYIPRIDIYAPTGRTEDYYRWGSMSVASCRCCKSERAVFHLNIS
jgi:hypothetical protein